MCMQHRECDQEAAGSHSLPKKIQNTKAVINPKNMDNRCFLYAICLGLLDLSKIETAQ